MNTLNAASAAILGAVLNTLWQAVAGTALVWLALRYTRLHAGTRHLVWWGWMAILLLLPAAPPAVRAWKGRNPAPVLQPAASIPAAFYRPLSQRAAIDPPAPVKVTVKRGPLVALAIWFALVLLQAIRLAWSFLYLRRLKRDSHPPARPLRENFEAWVMACGVHRPVRLLVSGRLASPMAVGFRHPAVILPETLLAELSPADLDHVLLHELAHVARRDDWSNLAGRLAAAFVIWHPAAAWVLRRIDREREIACDEWVVAATGAARPYAASLARLFELCWTRRREALATGMAGRGSHLGERIEMLLRRTGQGAGGSLARAGICTAVLLVLLIAGARAPRWVAFAQDTASHGAPRQLAPANPQSFLGALVTAGYGDLSVDDIIALKNRGVSADFLRGIARSGWGRLTTQQLIDLRTRGVQPEYLRELRDSGIRDLNIQGVIELRARGVQPEYPREIHALGFGPYTAQQIIELAAHGVRLDLFRALKESGFTHLAPNEIFDAQSSGLQAGNLREAKQYGANLSLGQIIRLKRAGVI